MNNVAANAAEMKVIVKTLIQSLDDEAGELSATGAADEELTALLNDGWTIAHEQAAAAYNPLKDRWMYTRVVRLERREKRPGPVAQETAEVAVPVVPLAFIDEDDKQPDAVQARRKQVYAAHSRRALNAIRARRERQPVAQREPVERKPLAEVTFAEALASGLYSKEEIRMVGNLQAMTQARRVYEDSRAALKQPELVLGAGTNSSAPDVVVSHVTK